MRLYRFGQFELDPDEVVLRRAQRLLAIQPQVFRVLQYLIERRGSLVTKVELLDAVWREEDVSSNVVAWSMSHVRRVLGQRRGSRKPIATVAGRGYCFMADVSFEDRPALSPLPALPPQAPTFVGRARVMSTLQRSMREAVAGRGALCVISGEAGMGKTRCLRELEGFASELGVHSLFAHCLEEPAPPPLWPIAAALRGLAHARPEFAERARALTLGYEACASGRDLAREEQRDVRFRAIERLAGVLRELARKRPTLLMLDDLHWADSCTLDLLAFIAPELRETPLCIVAGLRDNEREPAALRDQSLRRALRYAQSISLGPLGTAEVAELAFALSEHRPSYPLAEAVRRAAGGVPLFVEEVVRSLVARHGAEALERLGPDAVLMPPLVRELLRERVERLPAATVTLLASAAMIGDSFELPLLLALVELQPTELLVRLEPALASGQLECHAPHAYRFAQPFLRRVLYDDLPALQRIALHHRLEMLELTRHDDAGSHAAVARLVERFAGRS